MLRNNPNCQKVVRHNVMIPQQYRNSAVTHVKTYSEQRIPLQMMNINANVNVNTNPNTKQVNYIQNSPSNNSKYVNYSNLGFRDGSGGFNSGYVRASNGNMDAHVNQLSRTLTNTNSNSKLITSQSINPRNRSANKLTQSAYKQKIVYINNQAYIASQDYPFNSSQQQGEQVSIRTNTKTINLCSRQKSKQSKMQQIRDHSVQERKEGNGNGISKLSKLSTHHSIQNNNQTLPYVPITLTESITQNKIPLPPKTLNKRKTSISENANPQNQALYSHIKKLQKQIIEIRRTHLCKVSQQQQLIDKYARQHKQLQEKYQSQRQQGEKMREQLNILKMEKSVMDSNFINSTLSDQIENLVQENRKLKFQICQLQHKLHRVAVEEHQNKNNNNNVYAYSNSNQNTKQNQENTFTPQSSYNSNNSKRSNTKPLLDRILQDSQQILQVDSQQMQIDEIIQKINTITLENKQLKNELSLNLNQIQIKDTVAGQTAKIIAQIKHTTESIGNHYSIRDAQRLYAAMTHIKNILTKLY